MTDPRGPAAIVNARLRRREGRWRIAIRDGIITAVDRSDAGGADGRAAGASAPDGGAAGASAPSGPAPSRDAEHVHGPVIDARGGLVTGGFVNGHLHLCKVNTLPWLGDEALREYHGAGMGGAMTAIERAAAVKEHYQQSRLVPGIRSAVERAICYGTARIRAFADTDTRARLEGVRAVMQVRDEYADRIRIEVVAFPQDGVLRDPGAAELVAQALRDGADVVGGIPWIELTDTDMQAHVDAMMDLAVASDRPVSMLVDDAGDPTLRTTEMLAQATIDRGWQGRVTAQHARAMSQYPEPARRRLFPLLRRAGIGVVSDPHTGPLHADIDGLRAAGVPVALGQDDIADAYYPFGRNNMLEVAFLAAHLLWKTTAEDLDTLVDMIETDAARVLDGDGATPRGIAPGAPAHLTIHREPTTRQLLAEHGAPAVVLYHGRVVAKEGALV